MATAGAATAEMPIPGATTTLTRKKMIPFLQGFVKDEMAKIMTQRGDFLWTGKKAEVG